METNSKTRVLVIDDEPPIRLLCRVNLEAEGMKVIEAADGPTGLDQAREQLGREPGALPKLEILRKPPSIDAYEYEDFQLVGYEAQAHIKAPVAV
mgnify:CR=1 FL=1